jgi:hypothetical protein
MEYFKKLLEDSMKDQNKDYISIFSGMMTHYSEKELFEEAQEMKEIIDDIKNKVLK